MIKVLNAYSGIGGNRMFWENVEVTAVENNKSVADAYSELYPRDTVIVGDAHEYILNHYHEFDFIWSSPPCQSHSRARQCGASVFFEKGCKTNKPIYPDMKLWQEIIFLKHHAKCDWVVENVIPYYKPFIEPDFVLGKHFYWSNRFLIFNKIEGYRGHDLKTSELEKLKNINLNKYKFTGISKRQVLRNMVEPEYGNIILEEMLKEKNK